MDVAVFVAIATIAVALTAFAFYWEGRRRGYNEGYFDGLRALRVRIQEFQEMRENRVQDSDQSRGSAGGKGEAS